MEAGISRMNPTTLSLHHSVVRRSPGDHAPLRPKVSLPPLTISPLSRLRPIPTSNPEP